MIGGGTPRNASDPDNYDPGGTPWITPADLSGYARSTIARGARSLSAQGVKNSATRTMPAGTVLISSRAPVGYCVVAANPVTTNQGFKSLVLRPDLDPHFVRYYILRSQQYLQDNASGTTFKELSGAAMAELAFPVPPMDVQRATVARVDALFAEVDEGERALAAAREGVETYRKCLLKAAVTGELTADWRRANPPNETGEDLLLHMLDERRTRWTAEPKNRAKNYVEPASLETADLEDLPKGWIWSRLEQLCWDGPTNGYSPKASTTFEGTKSLKLTATSAGAMRLDPDCIKTLSEVIEPKSELFLASGDLLFQRGNTPDLVGIAAVYDGPPNCFVYPDLMIRVRTVMPILGEWCWRWANSPHGREFMMKRAQGAAGSMPKISGATVRDMPVPIGPLAELQEALRRLAGQAFVTSWADDLPLETIASLRQSILAAAFRGELVE